MKKSYLVSSDGKPYIETTIKHLLKDGKIHSYVVKRYLKKGVCETCKLEFYTSVLGARFCSRNCILWRGGITNRSNGYVWIKDWGHPSANSQGYVYLHRYVMEKYLGRILEAWEVVHHKDKNKHNNTIENLEVMAEADHARMHIRERNDKRKYIKTKFHHIDKSNCLFWKELI